jgi:purine-cytosine permease-like protein
MPTSTAEFTDEIGRVEQAGIEFIPEEGRVSSPRDVFAVFTGANLSWSVVILGWIPITLGLNFWGALTSSLLGIAIGALVVAPLATFGPRTGTNMPVSSGAVFGIRGRLVGSALGLLISLTYTAVVVWTSGDAMVASASRLFDNEMGTPATVAAYAIVSVALVVAALYGHATIVAVQKFIIPVAGAILLVGVLVFMGDFDSAYTGGEFGLGSFWPTWIFCLILGFSSPLSYAPQIGDYTRRVSQAVHRGRLMVALGLGLFVGLAIPIVFGAFTASAFSETTDSYMTDIVNSSPAWYVVGILIVAVLGGLGQGVLCVYSTGLDLESFIPKLNRFSTTALAGTVSVALVFVAVYVFDAVDAVVASTLLINVLVVPWTAILLVFILRNPHQEYDVYDLQAFAQRRKGGVYWFNSGFFWVAVLAWVVGGAFGVMTVNADLYVGPWANMAGGVDVSILGSAALSIATYLIGCSMVNNSSHRADDLTHDAGVPKV